MMRRLVVFGFSILLALCVARASAGVSASVDRNHIGETESFDLLIKSDGAMNAEIPNLDPLERDFEVLGNSRSANISIVNGRRTAFTEWRISLLPKRSGSLRIPALGVGSESTQPIDILVTADGGAGVSRNEDVKLELHADQESVYVQQQLLLTVRVLHAINLGRGASLDEPEIPGAVVRKLGENSFEKIIDGRRFGVFERRYAVFPQSSGELVLPPLRFEAQLGGGGAWFDPLRNRGRTLRLKSAPHTIKVLPPQPGSTIWLPARMLTLVETWDKSPQQLRVGESATRTVTISADGLTGAQLPPLPALDVKGLRFYPDQPKIEDTASDTGISGSRAESTAVIPTESGNIEFPEVRMRWWDTGKQRFEEAIVPGKTIRVLPAPGAVAAAPAISARDDSEPEPAEVPEVSTPPSSTPWPWISLCALLTLTTLLSSWQWWRISRLPRVAPLADTRPDPREREIFRQLARACQNGDAAAVDVLLLRWARTAFPALHLGNLSALLRFAADNELTGALQTLQRSRYARNEESANWNGAPLLARIEALRKRSGLRHSVSATDALPPLYT